MTQLIPEVLQNGVPHAELQINIGEETPRTISIAPGEYLIGRAASCHIPVDAGNVSRMHARLSFTGHRLHIEDLQSANGTFIGGERIELPTPIQSGAEIHIGAARIVIRFDKETLEQINSALTDPELGLGIVQEEFSGDAHKIQGTLGEGGMGVVLKASDQRIHRTVAMKVLRDGSEYAVDKLLRFVSEAQLTGQLEHPNIIPIYQLGINPDGQTFYTMKYVRGQTLQDILEALRSEDPLAIKNYPLPALLTIFQKICDAVAFAHSKGIVHRDLKPQNIMIGAYGEVLVMDWGLAKRFRAELHPQDVASENAASAPSPRNPARGASPSGAAELEETVRSAFRTLDGAVVGTPPFISPEQASGVADLGPESDTFVLGMILYAIVALRPPVLPMSLDDTLSALQTNQLIPLKKITHLPKPDGSPAPRLVHCPEEIPPPGLIAVIEKAMAFEPKDRYASVAELQEDLGAFQNGFATKAEHASFFRQLQLLISRRRREAMLLGSFLLFSQLLLGIFLMQSSKEKNRLEASRKSLEARNIELADLNEKMRRMFSQLRATAENNYADAIAHLKRNNFTEALEQINLALMGVPEGSDARGAFLLIRGHARTRLGFFTEALEDYNGSEAALPGVLPIANIREDLAAAIESGERPASGWAWEKKMPPALSHSNKTLKLLQPNSVKPTVPVSPK
jgi:serine/threonine protein kinase